MPRIRVIIVFLCSPDQNGSFSVDVSQQFARLGDILGIRPSQLTPE
jgi:hypothetical protein